MKKFTNIIFELKEQYYFQPLHVAREIIGGILGPDWVVMKIDPIMPHYAAIPKDPDMPMQLVWEKVHKLENEVSISYAEPDFEQSNDFNSYGSLIDCDEHLGGTENSWWAHEQIEALAAYKLKPNNASGTTLGRGILIGHIDTGYTKHPDIWQENLLWKSGYDYKDKKSDPLEPNWGWQKGHGTSTSSVIFSYHKHGQINGIAPSVNLIPIRVDDTVIVNMSRLISGIGHAVRTGCHIISISMGNLEGNPDAINSALKQAVDHGCIPICAAGQAGGLPVDIYPSKSPYSISATATDIRKRPWHKAFKSRYADVAAPGVSVWNAVVDHDKNQYYVDRGCGTSFATAITAGAAALWLGSWSPQYIWSLNGKQNTMATFRNVLYKYGVTTPANWDTENFGQGVLNVKTLLTQKKAEPKLVNMQEVEEFEEENKRKYPGSKIEYLTSLLPNVNKEQAVSILSEQMGIQNNEFEKIVTPIAKELVHILVNNLDLLTALNSKSELSILNKSLHEAMAKDGSGFLKKRLESNYLKL